MMLWCEDRGPKKNGIYSKLSIGSTLQAKTILVAMATKSLELATKLEQKSPAWRLKLRRIESMSLI